MEINFIEDRNIIKNIFKDYIKNLLKSSNKILSIKVNKLLINIDFNYLLNIYINNVIFFSNDEKLVITNWILKINKNYNQFKKFNNVKWNFVKLSTNIELSMPFTIQNTIFLTESIFTDSSPIYTLIHEKIHVIQRLYPDIFEFAYTANLGLIPTNIVFTDFWRDILFPNPDGLKYQHIYEFNNNYYLPILAWIENKTKQIVILIEKLNYQYITTSKYWNLNDFKDIFFKKYPDNISLYHPYEIIMSLLLTLSSFFSFQPHRMALCSVLLHSNLPALCLYFSYGQVVAR